jgi:tRNA nucleotidyltransferase (CCA-adding enzyme)
MVPLSMRVKPSKVRKWRTEIGDDLLADLLKHRLCDVIAKGVVDYDAMRAIARLEQIREDAVAEGVPVKVTDLPITGHDLIEIGLSGPAIGEVQRQLLHEVVSQPDREDREWLLGRAAKLATKVR